MRSWVKVALPVAVVGVGLVAVTAPVVMIAAFSTSTPTPSLTSCAGPADTPAAVTTTAAGLTASQRQVAGTIIAVAESDPTLGARAAVLGVMGALQESNLTNLPGGDRDSVGVFQQRPSQGWGTADQILQPTYAAAQFFAHLKSVPGWASLSPTEAIQAVQRSGTPTAYAKWQPVAEQLVGTAQPVDGAVTVNACELTSVAVGAVKVPAGTIPPAVQAQIDSANAQARTAIQFAFSQLGKPYLWGGTGPNAWDCSGLTQAAYGAAGVSLPRDTYSQVTVGQPVTEAELEPGDLVLPDPGHIQIYLGGGLIIEAPHTGGFVQVVPMWGFWAARRVV